MKTITFDKNCAGWTENNENNLLFLRNTAAYLEDLFKYRGYVYLNQIHENFGIGWNTNDKNICYSVGDDKRFRLTFEFEPANDGKIQIRILYYH